MTRHRFDEELDGIRIRTADMLSRTGEMLEEALHALRTQDGARCAAVLEADNAVDELEAEIEQECLRMLALQQPVVASDLRLLSAILKAVDDIERIGDHAVNIVRTAERMAAQDVRFDAEAAADLPRLGGTVGAMLAATADALAHGGPAAAYKIIARDDEVDVLYAELRREWQTLMRQQPENALLASYLLFVAHYLERIGDHCKNVAERLVYYYTGTGRGMAK